MTTLKHTVNGKVFPIDRNPQISCQSDGYTEGIIDVLIPITSLTASIWQVLKPAPGAGTWSKIGETITPLSISYDYSLIDADSNLYKIYWSFDPSVIQTIANGQFYSIDFQINPADDPSIEQVATTVIVAIKDVAAFTGIIQGDQGSFEQIYTGLTGIQGGTGLQGNTGLQGQTGIAIFEIQLAGGGVPNTTIVALSDATCSVAFAEFLSDVTFIAQDSFGNIWCPNLGLNAFTSVHTGQLYRIGVETDTLFTTTLFYLQTYLGIQGNTGLQGSQGLTGCQGFTGIAGTIGIQGYLGNTGIQGIQGPDGVQGVTGIQGIGHTGIQGIQGPDGVQGPQGDTGLGTTGDQGPQGDPGNDGIQGETGIQGIQGETGPFGGPQGNTGLQGLTGPGIVYETTAEFDFDSAVLQIKAFPGIDPSNFVFNSTFIDGTEGAFFDATSFNIIYSNDVPGIGDYNRLSAVLTLLDPTNQWGWVTLINDGYLTDISNAVFSDNPVHSYVTKEDLIKGVYNPITISADTIDYQHGYQRLNFTDIAQTQNATDLLPANTYFSVMQNLGYNQWAGMGGTILRNCSYGPLMYESVVMSENTIFEGVAAHIIDGAVWDGGTNRQQLSIMPILQIQSNGTPLMSVLIDPIDNTSVTNFTGKINLASLDKSTVNPAPGTIIFADDNHFYGYNGSAWIQLDNV